MMNMNMTDYQQQLIDSGEAVEFPVTIRYEQMCGGYKPRYETVKATLPDLGEGHEAIKMDGKQYHITNRRLYARLSHINRSVFQRGCGVVEDSFTLMEGDDKRQSVTDAYEEKYSDAVVVNNCIATPANVPLYARLYNNRLFITDKLDTELSYIGSQYVRSALPLMGCGMSHSSTLPSYATYMKHTEGPAARRAVRMPPFSREAATSLDVTFSYTTKRWKYRLITKMFTQRSWRTQKTPSADLRTACISQP